MSEIRLARLGFRGLAAALIGLSAVLAACSGEHNAGRQQTAEALNRYDENALLPGGSWIATAQVPEIAAYPDAKSPEPTHRLANPDENGTPLVFLVDGKDADADWIEVHLPVRPNGTKAWIRTSDVSIAQTQYRIKVDLTAHTLTVTENDKVTIETPVGVGKESTPTPGGLYYIKELIQPPNPNTVYGPYVFGLSGFSNVLTSMNGEGTGVIGLHGNNDPSSVGQSVSSGCIRLPNDVISQMTQFLPLGTPVRIVA